MECAYHPGRDAVVACVNCGKLICAECKAELAGKNYCSPCANEIFVGKKPTEVEATTAETPATKEAAAGKKPAAAKGASAGLTKGAATGAGEHATSNMVAEQKISGAWWLMPVFLMWVGGLVAWVVNKEKAPRKSRKMLIWGIILTFIWFVVWLIIVGVTSLATLRGAGIL